MPRRMFSTGVVLAAGVGAMAAMMPAAASPARAAGEVQFNGHMDYSRLRHVSRPGTTVRITESPGGLGSAAVALSRARKVIIDGECNSTCAWAFVKNSNSCFTANARFGFHGAHDPGLGTPMPAATDYWLAHTRTSLRHRIAAVRTSSQLVHVSADEMRRHYPERSCR